MIIRNERARDILLLIALILSMTSFMIDQGVYLTDSKSFMKHYHLNEFSYQSILKY
jgi:hypothetical protein